MVSFSSSSCKVSKNLDYGYKLLKVEEGVFSCLTVMQVSFKPGFDVLIEQGIDGVLQNVYENIAFQLMSQRLQYIILQPLIINPEWLLNVLEHPVRL